MEKNMVDKIGILLDCISDVVDDDSEAWRIKKAKILKVLEENERIGTAFEEFISWFEGNGDKEENGDDEEDDKEGEEEDEEEGA
jgi:hypothetical protein